MKNWSFGREKGVPGDWPKDDKGENIAPAFLEHVGGDQLELDIRRGLLRSCGIPTVCTYPNNGQLGKVVLGIAGGGVDVFVPETMLEDALEIINTPSENMIEEDTE